MVDAQQQLARAEAERNQLSQYQRELAKYEQDLEQWQATQGKDSTRVSRTELSDSTSTSTSVFTTVPNKGNFPWAEKNEVVWCSIRIMTKYSMRIHQELAESGIDLESDEYYSNLDSRLREELPNRFQAKSNAGNSGKPVQTVVSGTRTTGNGRSQNDRRVDLPQ